MKADLKELISKLTNTPIVVESGTATNWKWNKWSNGIIEAWFYNSGVPFTSAVNQIIGGVPSAISPVTTLLNAQINGTGSGFIGDLHHLWIGNDGSIYITPTTAGTYATSVYLCFKN